MAQMKKNSIEILSKSHTDKLYDHKFINGQGYFSANTKKILKKEVFKISTNPSEGVLFHPLTLHRSVNPSKTVNMRPRYSIDIRFFENDVKLKYKTSLIFKFKKLLKKLDENLGLYSFDFNNISFRQYFFI